MAHTKTLIPKPEDIRAIYFIGIGGIGMSALARCFKNMGARVSGYDKAATSLTRQLEAEGIQVHYEDNISMLDREVGLVVYTPAIPKEHTELNYYLNHDFPVVKRSDLLSMVTADSYSICIAGTHGKTTTSCMVAHILRDSGYGCNALLGGISVNYETNFWSNPRKVTVTEADEYDRSFLKLNPDVAVITAMDADHLDIYGTELAMQDAFVEFCGKTKDGGLLIYHKGISREEDLAGDTKISYNISDNGADAYIKNIQVENGQYHFDVVTSNKVINNISLQMGGRHNIENALVSVLIADYLKIDENKIREAVASFKGVKRRFEYVYNSKGIVMIDDYAHHPEELRALLDGVRELFPGRKCTIVFQPHLYTRTRDLAAGFSEVLSAADEILLLPIYPARELPIEGVSSNMIADGIHDRSVKVIDKEGLLSWASMSSPEVLVMAGAGDIDVMVEPVKQLLINKK